MCNEQTEEYLRQIAEAAQAQEYEYAGPFTIGGATGTYIVATPFNTECEYALMGAASSGAGNFTVAPYAAPGVLAFDGTDNLGPQANGKEGNALHGFVGNLAASTSLTYTPVWLPINGNSMVYAATSVAASKTLVITVMFRRLLVRSIPDMPRKSPVSNHRMQPRYGQSPEAQIGQAGGLEGLLQESREGRGIHGRAGIPAVKKSRLFPF
jgi:hypothetical protein